MKDLIEVHFDEILLVTLTAFFAILYIWRPEMKEFVAGGVAALYLSLRSKMKNGNGAPK